jgi:hypothetical protein
MYGKDYLYYIPKNILSNTRNSYFKCSNVSILDCYCVTARNGYGGGCDYDENGESTKDNRLFLKNVAFSEIWDADDCTIEDCYCITMNKTQYSYIKNVNNTNIFNNYRTWV